MDDTYTGAPPLYHASHAVTCLYEACNRLTHLGGWSAADIKSKLDNLRQRVAVEILPDLLKAEIEQARIDAANNG